jgi:hypothetical protein
MNNSVDISHEELYPKVDIYKGLLPDADRLYEILKKSEAESDGRFYLRKWDRWSVFGTYTQQKHDSSEQREHGQQYDDELYLSNRVYEAYDMAIKDYISRHNVQLPPTSRLMSSSFCKYDQKIDEMDNELTMQYHTDFIISEREMPGPKFFITCTTYINDDYDGGEISFFIDNKVIDYKPVKGSILVFPSFEPYWHGVREIKNGNKFLVRNFITYTYDGSESWLNNQKHYGAYRWAKMEQERIDLESGKNMLYLQNDKAVSYEEFLKLKGSKINLKNNKM